MALRIVMMGTGDFALPVFLGLQQSRHEVLALFTQPDRTGRGHHHHQIPLKEAALEHDIPVFQPPSINSPEGRVPLENLSPDLCVAAAYGQILSAEVIRLPRWGCINVHASLLPKYRGAAPVQHAILNGETETGVTVFQIEPKLDAGPILGMVRTEIGPDETAGQLLNRLAHLAVPLTLQVVDDIERGTTQPMPQEASLATRAASLKKSSGRIDWRQSAGQIARHVRAMQPWPTAFTFLQRGSEHMIRLILLRVRECQAPSDFTGRFPPGTVAHVDRQSLLVQTGRGLLALERFRPQGKREMTAAEFLRGNTVQPGDRFVDAQFPP